MSSAGGHSRAQARWARRGDIALRVLAAVPLGYAASSLCAMALARLLPGTRSGTTVAAALIGLALCAVLAMWAFAARSGWRAVWTITVAGGVAAGITWLSIAVTGRA
ncbi:hypothetical protein [Sphingomonas sp. PvP056]|jgi:hypothetical protein|uniref:hypothetical protein n=1 Tax=Sphingomonas sp. PvP056 TaxID=3156392 RepID=UPI003398B515